MEGFSTHQDYEVEGHGEVLEEDRRGGRMVSRRATQHLQVSVLFMRVPGVERFPPPLQSNMSLSFRLLGLDFQTYEQETT